MTEALTPQASPLLELGRDTLRSVAPLPPVFHGPGSASALRIVRRLRPNSAASARTLTPSRKCGQRIRSISATLIIPPLLSLPAVN